MRKERKLQYYVKQECLWIVRGYECRRKAYFRAVKAAVDGGGSSVGDGMPHGHDVGRKVEHRAMALADIEEWPETKRMRAVEVAKAHIGMDIQNSELRQRLADGIILNCQDRHRYPFRYLGLEGISSSDFNRRRERFLLEIADFLQIV